MRRVVLALTIIGGLLLTGSGSAFATPVGITTSDFGTLFGLSGSLVTLPSSLGGGTSGFTEFDSTGSPAIDATVDYAVWSLTTGLVFVYDIHLHSGSAQVDTFQLENPFGVNTAPLGFSGVT